MKKPLTRVQATLREMVGPKRALPTMGQIAAGSRFSRSYVCYVLNGRRQGTTKFVSALAGFLGVSMDAAYAALLKPYKPVSHSAPAVTALRAARARRRAPVRRPRARPVPLRKAAKAQAWPRVRS